MEPTIEEAYNLFDAIRYYGKHLSLDIAEIMFLSSEPIPLQNHWDDFDNFITVWDFFYKLARSHPRSSFGRIIVTNQIPSMMLLSLEQKDIFSHAQEYKKQVCYLLNFFDSISDYFEYEVKMMEKGYTMKFNIA